VKGYIGSAFTDGFAEQMPDYKAHACKHDAGKITTLLDTRVADVNARKALADDLIDLLSHYKPKETQAQLDIKAQARSEFETYLFLRSVSKSKHGSLLTTLQTQLFEVQQHSIRNRCASVGSLKCSLSQQHGRLQKIYNNIASSTASAYNF